MSSIIKPPGAGGTAFRQPTTEKETIGGVDFDVVKDTDINVGCMPPPQPDPLTGRVNIDIGAVIANLNAIFQRQNALARELLEIRDRLSEHEDAPHPVGWPDDL